MDPRHLSPWDMRKVGVKNTQAVRFTTHHCSVQTGTIVCVVLDVQGSTWEHGAKSHSPGCTYLDNVNIDFCGAAIARLGPHTCSHVSSRVWKESWEKCIWRWAWKEQPDIWTLFSCRKEAEMFTSTKSLRFWLALFRIPSVSHWCSCWINTIDHLTITENHRVSLQGKYFTAILVGIMRNVMFVAKTETKLSTCGSGISCYSFSIQLPALPEPHRVWQHRLSIHTTSLPM